MKRKILIGVCVLFSISLTFLSFSLTPTKVAATDTELYKMFTCDDGFPSQYCWQWDCMKEKQLFMWSAKAPIPNKWGLPSYDIELNAPKTGSYQCEITATGAYYEHKQDDPQANEVIEVFLNGNKVGTTKDPWCPELPAGYVPTPPDDPCHVSPRASYGIENGDGHKCGTAENGIACDDDAVTIPDGKTLKIDLSSCYKGDVAFVKTKRCPHCQYMIEYPIPPFTGMMNKPTNCEEIDTDSNCRRVVTPDTTVEILWSKACSGGSETVTLRGITGTVAVGVVARTRHLPLSEVFTSCV